MGWFGVHLHNNTLKHRFGLRPTLDAQCYARLCICFANYCTNQLHIVRRLAQR